MLEFHKHGNCWENKKGEMKGSLGWREGNKSKEDFEKNQNDQEN